MAVTRQIWPLMLLLLHVCLSQLPQPADAIASSQFEVTAEYVISNATIITETPPPSTVAQCAALCARLSGCGGFNLWPAGRCRTLLDTSLQFSYRQEMPGIRSGTAPAYTCRQRLLLDRYAPSGVQRLPGWPVPVYCDQELDGGGWTLLLTSATAGWTPEQVLARNEGTPSLSTDYSMLGRADNVLQFGDGDSFNYRWVQPAVQLIKSVGGGGASLQEGLPAQVLQTYP